MKKFVSLLLSVLMLVSVFSVFAAAEGDVVTPPGNTGNEDPAPQEETTYVITFMDNGRTVATLNVAAGEVPEAPAHPQPYSDADGRIFEFHAWISSADGKSYSPFDLPAASSDVVYTAEYYCTYEPSEKPTVTFFSFLQGIFQNLTKVFAAAANNVKTWTQHLGKGSDFVKAMFENVF